MNRLLKMIFKFLIRVYQYVISPHLGRNCRYVPTCSEYTVLAIDKYGPLKGSWFAFRRILSCGPWGGHGLDPVP